MSADIPWRVAAIAWIVSGACVCARNRVCVPACVGVSAGKTGWAELASNADWRKCGTGAIKACMVAAYRSTDFEVHRNWLAITSSLPLAQWYYEDTSEWTLDYPPLFAWFERVLGLAAPLFDTQMLRISAAPYASDATILFQRLSVIVTEAALLLALYTYLPSRRDSSKSSNPGPGIAILLALNAGLFITDHVHFQYNGLLLGMLLTSAAMVNNDQHLGAALLFATVLNMKHLFLALGPAYFVYLLRFHCLEPAATCWNPRRSASGALSRFCVLGAAVLAVFCVAWGPFVAAGGLAGVQQILKRLFPFGRGLCHAYWAPNVWVVYNLADKVRGHMVPCSTWAALERQGARVHCDSFSLFALRLCCLHPLRSLPRHAPAPDGTHARILTTRADSLRFLSRPWGREGLPQQVAHQ
jgi:alpha-1,3-glucosyltransferase